MWPERGYLERQCRPAADQYRRQCEGGPAAERYRAVDVKGDVNIEGKGSDIELENIAGQVTVNGSYSGTLQFKNLAKPLHLESRNTDLRVAQVPGTITMDLGDLNGSNLIGPIRLITRSKDIHLDGFTQSLELETERGDIDLKPGKAPLAKRATTSVPRFKVKRRDR